MTFSSMREQLAPSQSTPVTLLRLLLPLKETLAPMSWLRLITQSLLTPESAEQWITFAGVVPAVTTMDAFESMMG